MRVNFDNPTQRQATEMASALAFAAFVTDMEAENGALYCPRCGYVKAGDIVDHAGHPVYIEVCNNCGWVAFDNCRAVLTHDVPGVPA